MAKNPLLRTEIIEQEVKRVDTYEPMDFPATPPDIREYMSAMAMSGHVEFGPLIDTEAGETDADL
jgi:hypothetical protein